MAAKRGRNPGQPCWVSLDSLCPVGLARCRGNLESQAGLSWAGFPKVLASLALLFLGSSAEVSGPSGEIPRSVCTGPGMQQCPAAEMAPAHEPQELQDPGQPQDPARAHISMELLPSPRAAGSSPGGRTKSLCSSHALNSSPTLKSEKCCWLLQKEGFPHPKISPDVISDERMA